jgi:hypothetical protein
MLADTRFPAQRETVCARCNAAFVCGAGHDGRCWCADEAYRAPMPLSAGEDCLCPSCLRAQAAQSEAETSR